MKTSLFLLLVAVQSSTTLAQSNEAKEQSNFCQQLRNEAAEKFNEWKTSKYASSGHDYFVKKLETAPNRAAKVVAEIDAELAKKNKAGSAGAILNLNPTCFEYYNFLFLQTLLETAPKKFSKEQKTVAANFAKKMVKEISAAKHPTFLEVGFAIKGSILLAQNGFLEGVKVSDLKALSKKGESLRKSFVAKASKNQQSGSAVLAELEVSETLAKDLSALLDKKI